MYKKEQRQRKNEVDAKFSGAYKTGHVTRRRVMKYKTRPPLVVAHNRITIYPRDYFSWYI